MPLNQFMTTCATKWVPLSVTSALGHSFSAEHFTKCFDRECSIGSGCEEDLRPFGLKVF